MSKRTFFVMTRSGRGPFVISSRNVRAGMLNARFGVYDCQGGGSIEADLVRNSLRVCFAKGRGRDVVLDPGRRVDVGGKAVGISAVSRRSCFL